MKTIFLVALASMLSCTIFGQIPHSQEPVEGHYKQLGELSSQPKPERAWMDTVAFPPNEYGSTSIYVLVTPYYLTSREIGVLTKGITPPANSSEQTRKELDCLLALQRVRTSQQVKAVELLGAIGYWPSTDLLPSHPEHAQNLKDLFFEGRKILGDQCTAEHYPKTAILLKGIMRDMRIMEFTIKYHYKRPRPYHLESALRPLTKISSPSYASGHTLWAFLQAYTWGEILPDRRGEFIKLAEDIRSSREIMGIHFPSDNEAARCISYKMLTCYFSNARFLEDLEAAKSEWGTIR